ncbi:sina homologue [Carabus blaptoides fortunei]
MATMPEDCLEKLKCCACGYYLSCSPVYLKHNGDNLCGRCAVPHDEEHLIIRNTSYETVASVMFFPCKFKTVGCSKHLAWAKVKYHEEGCEYRPYNCPTSDCNWSGLHCNLKQHYEENHVNLLLEHPGNSKPNTTKDSEKRYLLPAFGLLFILHLKYVVSSSKLSYCVRFLGNTQFASFFEYILEITTGDSGNIRMRKTVQPTNTDVLHQETSIEININHLLGTGVISNIDDVIFNISIKLNNTKCMICDNNITSSVQLSSEGCFCENCDSEEAMENVLIPVQKQSVVPCKNANSGCIYQDIPLNMPKHEKWFCKRIKWTCMLCKQLIEKTSLYLHTQEKHATVVESGPPKYTTYSANYTYKGTFAVDDILFYYQFNFSDESHKFSFFLLSDLPKSDIKHFNCEIKVTNPNSKFCKELVLKHNISSVDCDWYVIVINDRKKSLINIPLRNTASYGLEFSVKKI